MDKLQYFAKRGLLGLDAFDAAHAAPETLPDALGLTEEQKAALSAYYGKTAEQQIQERLDVNKIMPGDETKLAKGTLRNTAVEQLGLPADWKQTVAEEKQWMDSMGTTMGSAAGKLSPKQLDDAAAKLTPELAKKLRALNNNPVEGVDVVGPVNNNLQKLKDLLGNKGRTTFKSK